MIMKKWQKLIHWIPIVGFGWEIGYAQITGKIYLSNPTHSVRYLFSILWHASWIVIMGCSAIKG